MFKKPILSLLFLCSISTVVAQEPIEWKEASSKGYTYKYVTNDATKARFYTLKNGLTVILSPTKKTLVFRLTSPLKQEVKPILLPILD